MSRRQPFPPVEEQLSVLTRGCEQHMTTEEMVDALSTWWDAFRGLIYYRAETAI